MAKNNNVWLIMVLVVLVLAMREKVPSCSWIDYDGGTPENIIDQPTVGTISDEKAQLETEGRLDVYVWGSSMYPTVKPGQTCECIKKNQYQVGDIIAFHVYDGDNLMFVIHRIVEVTPNGVLTKGDNNGTEDPWLVPFSDIFCSVPEEYMFKNLQ